MLIISLVMLVPIVPFLLFGAAFETWAIEWTDRTVSKPVAATLLVGLLATDILLPVPSSLLSTLGGWKLGWLGGTLFSWFGMTLGAVLGFLMARRWGKPVAIRLSSEEELLRMQALSQQYGAVVLIVFRGVPVLAEASVLLMGVHRMSWQRFLPPVVLSNLGIAWSYSAFGDYAQQNQWLPLALGVAIALPVLLAMIVKLILSMRESARTP